MMMMMMAAIRHRTHTRTLPTRVMRIARGPGRRGERWFGAGRFRFVEEPPPPVIRASERAAQDGCSSTLDITAVRHRDVELELKVLRFFEIFWESRELI